MGGSDNLPIGPGVWGFIAAFVLALALWLLMRNMNSRMRRMAYRERDRLEREESGSPDASTGTAGTSTPAAEADPVDADRAGGEAPDVADGGSSDSTDTASR